MSSAPSTGADRALHRRYWAPEEAWATLAIVHGLGEHGGRWEHVGRYFAAAGLRVTAIDLPGHGLSPGVRGHARYDRLLEVIAAEVHRHRHDHPELPSFLYGHSMGGNLVLNLALRQSPPVAGIIATAPALRPAFEPPAWKLRVGRVAAHVWSRLSFQNELDTTALATRPGVERDYLADPLVHDRISAGLAIAILDSGEWALEHAGQLRTPTLLMHGTRDRLVSIEATREFVRGAGAAAELSEWPGLFHELHNEPVAEAILDSTVAWVRARTTHH